MKTLRVCTLVLTACFFGPSFGPSLPCVAPAEAITLRGGEGVITGELVVTDASRNRFRLVGHSGSFAAPAGIPAEAFDGKPVEVELARDGRVLGISEMPMPIDRATHEYDVITGQLEPHDAAMGTFTIAGDGRMYVAPASVDVRAYARRIVEVRLDEQGRVRNIEPVVRSGDVPTASTCLYNGRDYSNGAALCQSGKQYLCESGQWRDLSAVCASDGVTASGSLRICTYAGASVAHGSSICRDGTTFRCVDGNWINVGTRCS